MADHSQPNAPANIRVGPAGWSYSDWSGVLYPKKRPRGFHEAAYLAQWFDTIEINTSFYSPMRPDHCRLWLAQVEANPRFLFTAKLWQRFTHETGATAQDEKDVRAGFDILRDADKLGAVLVQFPFSFHREPGTIAHLRNLLDRFGDYPLVVEVRHATWNDKSFYEMLQERGVGFCNIDQPVIGRSLAPPNAPRLPSATFACTAAATTRGSATIPKRPATSAITISIRKENSNLGRSARNTSRGTARKLSSSPTIITKRKAWSTRFN